MCGALIGEIVPYLTNMQQCCMSVLSFGWLSCLEVGGISWACGRKLVKQLVGPLLVNDVPNWWHHHVFAKFGWKFFFNWMSETHFLKNVWLSWTVIRCSLLKHLKMLASATQVNQSYPKEQIIFITLKFDKSPFGPKPFTIFMNKRSAD